MYIKSNKHICHTCGYCLLRVRKTSNGDFVDEFCLLLKNANGDGTVDGEIESCTQYVKMEADVESK